MQKKIINQMIAMMCAASMSLGGVAVSVGAEGGDSSVVSEQQSKTNLEEAKKRFDDLCRKMSNEASVTTVMDLEEELGVTTEGSDFSTFVVAFNASCDLRFKINDGWNDRTLDEQIKLIDEYESSINNCIKVAEDLRVKYENKMSIININNEKAKQKDDIYKIDIDEKEKLLEKYNQFKKTRDKWNDFIERVKILGDELTGQEDKFEDLEDRFESCEQIFSSIDTNKDANKWEADVNRLTSNSEGFMKSYESRIIEDEARKEKFDDALDAFQQKTHEFKKWKKEIGLKIEITKASKQIEYILGKLAKVNYKWTKIRKEANELEQQMRQACLEINKEMREVKGWEVIKNDFDKLNKDQDKK